ncbi:hypothetical protein GGQ84_001027 [Desulfitispora alkaliphila]|uniref:glycoside hydrolase family 26 protein n=1 Tax=Desulfitispora alkaliphila TaxID=622674 RepID=UPI003D1DEFF6
MSIRNQFLFILFLLSLFIALPAVASAKPDLSNYTGAKFEPVEGSYLGAYVVQDVNIDAHMPTFNEITGKHHSSFFRYLGYGREFPRLWVQEVKDAGAVPQIAWEPNSGLEHVNDDEYLRSFARACAEADVPIFLRFASEMNGDWSAYSGDPDEFIKKWRLVHRVMAEEAPNVAMVWTVFTFPQGNILDYYPGDDYVDWVGVNVYNVVYHNNNINHYAAYQDPIQLMDYVYRTFGDRKPIHISEWGVTHYTITDGKYYVEWSQEKLRRMYDGIRELRPRAKAIYYFDVNNLVNAPEGRRINNYSLTCDEDKLNTYSEVVNHDFYLSRTYDNTVNVLLDGAEVVLTDNLIVTDEKTYIPVRDVAAAAGYYPSWAGNALVLEKDGENFSLPLTTTGGLLLHQGKSYLELQLLNKILGQQVELAGDVIVRLPEPLRSIEIGNEILTFDEDFPYFTIYGEPMLPARHTLTALDSGLKLAFNADSTITVTLGKQQTTINPDNNPGAVIHKGTLYMSVEELEKLL